MSVSLLHLPEVTYPSLCECSRTKGTFNPNSSYNKLIGLWQFITMPQCNFLYKIKKNHTNQRLENNTFHRWGWCFWLNSILVQQFTGYLLFLPLYPLLTFWSFLQFSERSFQRGQWQFFQLFHRQSRCQRIPKSNIYIILCQILQKWIKQNRKSRMQYCLDYILH